MRQAVRLMLTAGLAMATVGVAHAESPELFIKRLLLDPGAVFSHHRHASRAPAAAAAKSPDAAAAPPDASTATDVPLPRLRPITADAVPHLAYQAEPTAAIPAPADEMPLPRISPADAAPPTAGPVATPDFSEADRKPTVLASLPPPATPLPEPAPPPPVVAQSTCGPALAALGVEAEPLPPITDGACGVPDPVSISALEGGAVAVKGNPVTDCAIATTLATWMNDKVQPAATSMLGARVTGLRVLDAYTCRTRDSIPDAKLSQHAFGNAIDIGAFQIGGKRWVTVGEATGTDADFLAAVRKSACGPFTTVLGPGSDSYHSSHFHLDLAKRRTAGPSRGLVCE